MLPSEQHSVKKHVPGQNHLAPGGGLWSSHTAGSSMQANAADQGTANVQEAPCRHPMGFLPVR